MYIFIKIPCIFFGSLSVFLVHLVPQAILLLHGDPVKLKGLLLMMKEKKQGKEKIITKKNKQKNKLNRCNKPMTHTHTHTQTKTDCESVGK